MPDSEAKKKWMKQYAVVIPVKFMRRTEADIVDYIDSMFNSGVGKATLIKSALREYMANHPLGKEKKNGL